MTKLAKIIIFASLEQFIFFFLFIWLVALPFSKEDINFFIVLPQVAFLIELAYGILLSQKNKLLKREELRAKIILIFFLCIFILNIGLLSINF